MSEETKFASTSTNAFLSDELAFLREHAIKEEWKNGRWPRQLEKSHYTFSAV